MLYGLPPPNVKETVKEMKKIFVDKEKMLRKESILIFLKKLLLNISKDMNMGKLRKFQEKK